MLALAVLFLLAPRSALLSTAQMSCWDLPTYALARTASPVALTYLFDTPLGPTGFLLVSLAIIALILACFFLTYRNLDRAIMASRRHEARFLAIANSTLDAFFILEAVHSAGDPNAPIEDFVFTYLNGNAEKIIAKPREEVLGARLTYVLPIKPNGTLFEQYRQVVLTGAPLTHEFPLNDKDIHGPWMRHHVERFEDGLAVTASEIVQNGKPDELTRPPDHYDPLTGLPNRNLLTDRIQQAIARATRYRSKVAVFLVNLDGFNQVNETYGRIVGDQVLVHAAQRLKATVRCTDSVIRLGGDEFVIVLPEIALEGDIRRTAATLIAVLLPPVLIGGQSVEITSSVGVAIYPDSASSAEELLHRADLAMYRAKCQGKSKYILFSPASGDEEEQQCAD